MREWVDVAGREGQTTRWLNALGPAVLAYLICQLGKRKIQVNLKVFSFWLENNVGDCLIRSITREHIQAVVVYIAPVDNMLLHM